MIFQLLDRNAGENPLRDLRSDSRNRNEQPEEEPFVFSDKSEELKGIFPYLHMGEQGYGGIGLTQLFEGRKGDVNAVTNPVDVDDHLRRGL